MSGDSIENVSDEPIDEVLAGNQEQELQHKFYFSISSIIEVAGKVPRWSVLDALQQSITRGFQQSNAQTSVNSIIGSLLLSNSASKKTPGVAKSQAIQ